MRRLVEDASARAAGATVALQDVDLDVGEHEFVTLVGASGCGKSTLLRIVAGLEYHTSGEVVANGKPVTGSGADRAMVFQQYSLYPWLNVLENIRFSRKLKANRGEFTSARGGGGLGPCGCAAQPDGPAGGAEILSRISCRAACSSAWRSRARCMPRPPMLLMDEPFGALDAQTREVMHDLILHVFHLEKSDGRVRDA